MTRGVPATLTSALMGTLSGAEIQRRELMQQADAIVLRFSKPDNSAAAYSDSALRTEASGTQAIA